MLYIVIMTNAMNTGIKHPLLTALPTAELARLVPGVGLGLTFGHLEILVSHSAPLTATVHNLATGEMFTRTNTEVIQNLVALRLV